MKKYPFVVMLLLVSGLFVACESESDTQEAEKNDMRTEVETEFWKSLEESFMQNCTSEAQDLTPKQQKLLPSFCECTLSKIREQYPTMDEIIPIMQNPDMMDAAAAECAAALGLAETEGE